MNMQERSYICKESGCETFFTVLGIWSACSLVCPLCQSKVKQVTNEH